MAELDNIYYPPERAQAWKIEFRNRNRKPKEDFARYAQDLKRLAAKAYRNQTVEAQEQWVLDQFIQGLNSVEMRGHVTFGHPNTLNQAISLATEFEAFQTSNNDRRKPSPVMGSVNAMSSPKVTNETNDKRQTTPTRITEQKQSQSSSTGSSTRTKMECRYCKRTNHVIEDCRKLKWKREQEAKLKQTAPENPPPPPSEN